VKIKKIRGIGYLDENQFQELHEKALFLIKKIAAFFNISIEKEIRRRISEKMRILIILINFIDKLIVKLSGVNMGTC
jgi:hypothetical protein